MDAMYETPGYLSALTLAGTIGILALTCVVLYGAARRGRRSRARRLVRGQYRNRGGRLVPHAARKGAALDGHRAGQRPGRPVGGKPDSYGGARTVRSGH